MSRTELTLITFAILFLAFLLGWFAYWAMTRLTRVTKADLGQLESLAQQLAEAEDIRDQAIAYVQEREAQLSREITQLRAELEAAMDGLRSARGEVEYLRAQAGS